jgi:carbonic anhydrase
MRKYLIIIFVALGCFVCGGAVGRAVTEEPEQGKLLPDQVIRQLLEGNTRFVKQQMTSLVGWGKAGGASASKPGRPCAVILTCADAHIPPELLFDRGAGCLFVLRVAGNIVNPALLGSIELAVEQLGVPVVMVLAHERCGTVATAVAAKGTGLGNFGALLKAIEPAVLQAERRGNGATGAELLEMTIELHAKLVAESLIDRSVMLKNKAGQGQLKVVAAKLDSDDGRVVLLD